MVDWMEAIAIEIQEDPGEPRPNGNFTPGYLKEVISRHYEIARRAQVDMHQWDNEKKQCTCGWKPHPLHDMSHLHIEENTFQGLPHIWIQWKGTDVCCDIYCDCGASSHFDGDFLYFFRCSNCGQVWEIGTYVAMYKVKDNRADGSNIK